MNDMLRGAPVNNTPAIAAITAKRMMITTSMVTVMPRIVCE